MRKRDTIRPYKEFGRHLLKMRLKTGLTRKSAGERLGFGSPQFLFNIECGIALPPLNKLSMLRKLYEIDAEDIITLIIKINHQLPKEAQEK